MSTSRAFEAPDLIEVMEEAVRYNRFLIEELLAWSAGLGPIVDFGAGNGRFAVALHERGADVRAVEPDPALREKIEARGVRACAGLADLTAGSFDGLYTINVLEHLEDDRTALREFHACLAPGGRLFVYVPAFQVLFSANDARVGHVRRYRLRELAGRVEAAGFTVDRARYVDCAGFLAGLAYRFFGDAEGGLDVGAVKLYDRAVFPASRALDRVFDRVLGKNLLLHATRPQSAG